MKPLTIGITGGIGSGKSSVSKLLASYCNAPLIDIDKQCRELLEPGHAGWLSLERTFGTTFFDAGGRVDRPLLRKRLFAEPALRKQLDDMLHPLVRTQLKAEVANIKKGLIFIDIPLLFEAGWQEDVDYVVVVYAGRATQRDRVVKRDSVSPLQAETSVDAQMDLGEKMQLADFVIDNDGAWKATRKKVCRLAEQLESRGQ